MQFIQVSDASDQKSFVPDTSILKVTFSMTSDGKFWRVNLMVKGCDLNLVFQKDGIKNFDTYAEAREAFESALLVEAVGATVDVS